MYLGAVCLCLFCLGFIKMFESVDLWNLEKFQSVFLQIIFLSSLLCGFWFCACCPAQSFLTAQWCCVLFLFFSLFSLWLSFVYLVHWSAIDPIQCDFCLGHCSFISRHLWTFSTSSPSLFNLFVLSFTFLNVWNTIIIAVLLSYLQILPFCHLRVSFYGLIFLLTMDNSFLLICILVISDWMTGIVTLTLLSDGYFVFLQVFLSFVLGTGCVWFSWVLVESLVRQSQSSI